MSTSFIAFLFTLFLVLLSSPSAIGFSGIDGGLVHPRPLRIPPCSKRRIASRLPVSLGAVSQSNNYVNGSPIRTLAHVKVSPREMNRFSRIPSRLTNVLQFDKSKAASLGVAFAMTYNFISNINGSITLSTAWYIASKRTGLSPLVGGQWKALVSAYGSLYLFVTLMRPLRFAMAISLTKHTEHLIEKTQSRLGCSRPVAVSIDVAMGLFLWISCMAGGIMFASTISGVPVY